MTKIIKNEALASQEGVVSYVCRWGSEARYETFGMKRVYDKQITTVKKKKKDYKADISRFSPIVTPDLRRPSNGADYQVWKGMDFQIYFFDFSSTIQLYFVIKK